ncbi:hypothetical protein GCM10017056_28130 [Seohaeicola zhoushanensis]|uniref:Uncharacterized protein n=1 Tax=Seohaeicola zhoushanensis TaxID=1569283 RepID=A0A8J3M8T1_9RHOB|nr:hypothetical protein GCM10017056_28130 [Seohaeicola zhoushanensis]
MRTGSFPSIWKEKKPWRRAISGWWGIGPFECQLTGGVPLTLTLSPEGRGDAGLQAEARA